MDSQDVGRLLSLISHEVRGPLGVMRGYLRLLAQRNPELSEPHRQAVRGALRAGERAAELLGQISLLAQVSRGEAAFAFHATPLAEVVVAATAEVVLPEDPTVVLEVAADRAVTVAADANFLRMALTALISAVVRAQPSAAGVRVGTLDQHRNATPGVVIDIGVTDAIDATDASEHALDVTRAGLGLDLPIAAAVIAAHFGEVVERRRGTQLVAVVVWLPLAQ